MNFEDFKERFKCSISRKMECIGHKYCRNIEVKSYIMYIDIRNMLPFKPATIDDCNYCICFSSDISSDKAKQSAYDFIKSSGSLEFLEEKLKTKKAR